MIVHFSNHRLQALMHFHWLQRIGSVTPDQLGLRNYKNRTYTCHRIYNAAIGI